MSPVWPQSPQTIPVALKLALAMGMRFTSENKAINKTPGNAMENTMREGRIVSRR